MAPISEPLPECPPAALDSISSFRTAERQRNLSSVRRIDCTSDERLLRSLLNRRFLAYVAWSVSRQDGRTNGIRREPSLIYRLAYFIKVPDLRCCKFVIIDTEHGNIADDQMHVAVGVIAAHGVSPMVRIPAPENWIVKRTLDTGGKCATPCRLRVKLMSILKHTRYSVR